MQDIQFPSKRTCNNFFSRPKKASTANSNYQKKWQNKDKKGDVKDHDKRVLMIVDRKGCCSQRVEGVDIPSGLEKDESEWEVSNLFPSDGLCDEWMP